MNNTFVRCILSLTIVVLTGIVWGSIILNDTKDAHLESRCYKVWEFCLTCVIALAFYLYVAAKCIFGKSYFLIDYILLLIFILTLFMWSWLILTNQKDNHDFTVDGNTFRDSCHRFFSDNYPQLWVMAQIFIWSNIVVAAFSPILIVSMFLFVVLQLKRR